MNKPQPEPPLRPAFDQQERESIRSRLRRYMEEHCIGTPTLQLRIIEADAPRRRELPLSTLQRFLTASHRTSDAYVEMCARFLEHIGAVADGPQFGSALAAFIGDAELPAGTLAAEYAGDFQVREGDEYGLLYETFASFSAVPGQPYLAVSETVASRKVVEGMEGPRRRHPYEGVLVANPPLVHVLLRSAVTRQPKIYCLKPDGEAGAIGFAGEASYIDLEHELCRFPVKLGRATVV